MGNEQSQRAYRSRPLYHLSKTQVTELRRKSLSAGDLPAPLAKQVRGHRERKAGYKAPSVMGQESSSCRRPRTPVNTPARDLTSPACKGYLDYQDEYSRWISVWCVAKDQLLYIYKSPSDDAAVDTVSLPGLVVQQRVLPLEQMSWQIELCHQTYTTEVLRAETEGARNMWLHHLHEASQKVSLEGLNLERGSGKEFDEDIDVVVAAAVTNETEWRQELVRMKKQSLLEEVLQQKEELEKRQALYKLRKQCSPSDQSPVKDTSTSQKLNDAEKQMLGLMHLKRRKVSTQLKFDSLNKSLQAHQAKKNKKKGFWFGSKNSEKNAPEIKREPSYERDHLEAQLIELREELHTLDRNMVKTVQSFARASSNPNLSSSLPEKELRVAKSQSPGLMPYLTKKLSEDSLSERSSSRESSRRGSLDSLNKGLIKTAKDGEIPEIGEDKLSSSIPSLTDCVSNRSGSSPVDEILLKPLQIKDSPKLSWTPKKLTENCGSADQNTILGPSPRRKASGVSQCKPAQRRSTLIPQELAQSSRPVMKNKRNSSAGALSSMAACGTLDSAVFAENYAKPTPTSTPQPKKATLSRGDSTSSDRSSVSSCSSRLQISEDALKNIAAFEELVQESLMKV